MTIESRKLADTTVFPIGLGGMPMSLSSRPAEERSVRTIQAAVEAGVTLIDTADAYSRDDRDAGHNEELIARALEGRRDGVLIACARTASTSPRSTARTRTSRTRSPWAR